MVKDEYDINDIYKIDIKDKLDKRKVLIIIFSVIALILIYIVALKSIQIMNQNKIYKQYEFQIMALQKAEQDRIAQIEAEKERIRKERNPNLTEVGKENISNVYKSATKRVFLTFDDGPSTVTPIILDTLKQENIKATFFVLGSRVDVMPDMVKRMYEEGHYVANHGYSHLYSSVYESPQSVLDEYNRCNDSVRNAIGVSDYNSHLFRFPGGLVGGKYADIKSQAKELLFQNNIVNVDWNSLNGDAETNDLTPEFELQRLRETTENKNSIVILMHDAPAKKVTAETLPQIITYLKEQGYEFKTFYEIIK